MANCKFCGVALTYDRKKMRFMQALMAHWEEKHPEQAAMLKKGMESFGGQEQFEHYVDESIKQVMKNIQAQDPSNN